VAYKKGETYLRLGTVTEGRRQPCCVSANIFYHVLCSVLPSFLSVDDVILREISSIIFYCPNKKKIFLNTLKDT